MQKYFCNMCEMEHKLEEMNTIIIHESRDAPGVTWRATLCDGCLGEIKGAIGFLEMHEEDNPAALKKRKR